MPSIAPNFLRFQKHNLCFTTAGNFADCKRDVVHSWFERSERVGETWITSGSDLVGQRLVRTFHGKCIVGQVAKWLPQGGGDNEPAL